MKRVTLCALTCLALIAVGIASGRPTGGAGDRAKTTINVNIPEGSTVTLNLPETDSEVVINLATIPAKGGRRYIGKYDPGVEPSTESKTTTEVKTYRESDLPAARTTPPVETERKTTVPEPRPFDAPKSK